MDDFLERIERLKNTFLPDWSLDVGLENKTFNFKSDANENSSQRIFKFIQQVYKVFNSQTLAIKLMSPNEFELKFSLSLKKYRRIYTSGCFDVFHFGHLNILQKSKEMCDHLIVGVSTDELILKEKGRVPVIPFKERVRVVKALSCVDEVIPQYDKNKQSVVDKYEIDAITVGDDWRGRFPKTSCPVEYLTYTKSVSSSLLKDTLQLLK